MDTQCKVKSRRLLNRGAFAALFSAVVILGGFCASSRSQTPAEHAQSDGSGGNVEKGKQLYTSYGCYECHGRQAQGSRTSGPRLAPNPIAFSAVEKYLRQPKGQMPPYTSKVVSDADLRDIYAFLKSLPQPPAVSGIPLLN